MFKLICSLLLFANSCFGGLYLKENFKKTEAGDYIISHQCNNYTLMAIREKGDTTLTIEEITVPEIRRPAMGWKEWVEQGAPGNTCRVRFTLDVNTGQILQSTHTLSKSDSFLPTLLNLRLEKVPAKDRKRIGGPSTPRLADRRPFWNPPLIFSGKRIEGVSFDAWRTLWPHDGTELSGQLIVAYVPEESSRYPAYFPYWLEVGGVLGKAKLRIVDSGKGLQ